MPGNDPLQAIAEALGRIADQMTRYNDQHAPAAVTGRSEAEVFKASYERENEGARELHNYLTGQDSSLRVGRAQGQQDRCGKKKAGAQKR